MAEPQGVKIYHFRHENCGNAFRAALVLPLLDCVLIMAEGTEQTSYSGFNHRILTCSLEFSRSRYKNDS